MFSRLIDVVVATWLVLGEMSPYLLGGFVMAGLIAVFLSPEWIERHLGRRGFGPVVKASLLGVPLPLCSCGVIPVAASVRRHGASRAATLSFLLSTPQTGVDSIAVTYSLLGPVFALVRPIAAFVTGLVGGGLVLLFGEKDPPAKDDHEAANGGDHPPHADTSCADGCCGSKKSESAILRGLRYGLLTLPRDIGGALLLGALIAGAISEFIPPQQLQPYVGGGILSMLLMVAVGIPLYVCATASVPIAAGFIHLGASPGAALAFLIAGPATNAATIATVWKILGRRTTLVYLLTIAVTAIGGGLAFDALMQAVASPVPDFAAACHSEGASWTLHAWAAALLGVLAFSYAAEKLSRRGSHPPLAESQNAALPAGEEQLTLTVSGMTCNHCVQSATRALQGCRGVVSVEIRLGEGRALVAGKQLDAAELCAALVAAGFSADIAAPPTPG